MRPYYVGRDTEARLARMTPKNRRMVLAHARQQALELGSPGDIERHLYAVTGGHLAECGFPKYGPVETASVEEEFLDYWAQHDPTARRTRTITRKEWKRWLKLEGTIIHQAFVYFRAGWDARPPGA